MWQYRDMHAVLGEHRGRPDYLRVGLGWPGSYAGQKHPAGTSMLGRHACWRP